MTSFAKSVIALSALIVLFGWFISAGSTRDKADQDMVPEVSTQV